LTGKELEPIQSAVRELRLIDSLARALPARTRISEKVRQSIEAADLICYPMGSFYTSLIANLLPGGVGRAIAAAGCPRVYIPNTGHDPEQNGMSVVSSVEALARYARADAGPDLPLARIVNLVILDRDPDNYAMQVDVAQLERMGVQVLSLDLVTDSSHPYIHPQRLTETLLSLT
jgi:2-phospho-L-lactate transferase/gluconeogenesis factor (CofD/UPF0052 family)